MLMKLIPSIIFFILFVFFSFDSYAQLTGRTGGQNMNAGHFYGKLVDLGGKSY